MAQQTIDLGAAPNDGTGDTLRVAGDKINDNFDELYAAVGGDLGALRAYEEQPSGTAGGGSTANTWTTRVLNTIALNTIAGASIASNTITLPAGTYDVFASAPVYAATVQAYAIRLYNSSDSTVVALGETAWQDYEARPKLQARFTLAATKNLVLQTISGTTVATNGLGVNGGGFGLSVPNHFSDIMIRKVA